MRGSVELRGAGTRGSGRARYFSTSMQRDFRSTSCVALPGRYLVDHEPQVVVDRIAGEVSRPPANPT